MALSFRTQNRLSALIQAIAEGEKKTEVVRQVLAEQKLFEPHTAFRRLDLTRDGYISSSELVDFLQNNNIVASTKESLALFAGLDYNEDGLISYNDFVNTVLPQEDEKLKTLSTLRNSYYLEAGEPLPYEVEWGLARVLEQEIKNYRNIENLKDMLASSYDYNTLDAFNAIDEEMLGFIDHESIDKFQRSSGKILADDEIQGFLRVVGDNGRVTYTQFANAVGGTRPVSQISPTKYDRIASPYKSRDQYHNQLQEELNRSINRTRRQLVESQLQEQQDRLNRSMELIQSQNELQRSQQNLERLERQMERQRSQEKLERLERSMERQRSIDRLNRSIEMQRSADRLERQLERKRSQDRLDRLERSLQVSRAQANLNRTLQQQELNRSIDNLNRSIELRKAQEDLNRSRELQRSVERSRELQRSAERLERSREIQRSVERMERSRELQRSQERLQRTMELRRSQERFEEMQKSQDRLNRSIEKSRRLQMEADILREQNERRNREINLQKSLERSRRLERSQERIRDLQRSQERLNRSIEQSKLLQMEADMRRSQREREAQQQQVELEYELQKSINKSRRLESQILDSTLKASAYDSPSRLNNYSTSIGSPMRGNEESELVKTLKGQVTLGNYI